MMIKRKYKRKHDLLRFIHFCFNLIFKFTQISIEQTDNHNFEQLRYSLLFIRSIFRGRLDLNC